MAKNNQTQTEPKTIKLSTLIWTIALVAVLIGSFIGGALVQHNLIDNPQIQSLKADASRNAK